jgi:hypothetical protein
MSHYVEASANHNGVGNLAVHVCLTSFFGSKSTMQLSYLSCSFWILNLIFLDLDFLTWIQWEISILEFLDSVGVLDLVGVSGVLDSVGVSGVLDSVGDITWLIIVYIL